MRPGDVIENKYEIIRKIASAGFGTVYEGWDILLDRPVAIKSILPNLADEEKFINMFMDEAVHTAKLTHENIVQVHDLVRTPDNQLFIVMQFIDGQDLRSLLKIVRESNEPIPVELVAFIISRTCAALRYAHDSKDARSGKPLNLVHRDVSPANVMVAYDGSVKLMDFGIAKGDSRRSEVTKTGVLKGKISYMSPEQAMGHSVDTQSDIYSLGIVMFELLTAERPFKGNNDLEVLQKVAQNKFDRKPLEDSRIPHKLREIVLKAMEKDKSKRYQSAQEMYLDLHSYFSSIDTLSLQTDLAKYMRMKFEDQLKDRENITPISQIDSVPKSEKIYEGKTETMPRRKSEEKSPKPQKKEKPSKKGGISLGKIAIPVAILIILAVAGFFGFQAIQSGKAIGYIESIPNGAVVFIGDQKLGTTPMEIPNLPANEYDLTLRMAKFNDVILDANVSEDNTFSIDGVVGLEKENRKNVYTIPFSAKFNLNSRPERATVYVDDERIGETPITTERKLEEDMTFRIELAGFESPENLTVNWQNPDLPVNKSWKIEETFFEDDAFGYTITGLFSKLVDITSNPSGAELYIDGTKVNKTPLEQQSLSFGEHVFRAESGNLSTGEITIEITEDTKEIELTLKKTVRFVASTASGRELTDATVVVSQNGKVQARGKSGESLPVPTGQNVATFSRYGYYDKTVRFNTQTDTLVAAQLREVKPYVRVVVTDMQGNPVSGAKVMYKIGNGSYRTASSRTNSRGIVTVEVESGKNYFKADKSGYRTSPEVTIISGNSGTKEAPLKLFPQ